MNSLLKTVSFTLALAAGWAQAASADGFTVPDAQAFPEGIAVARDGTAYVGSIYEGKIYRRAPGAAAAEEFIAPGAGGLVSAIGLMLDEAQNRLWVCSSDPGVGRLTGQAKPALLAFDAATGELRARYELPGGGFCNDMAMAADGTLYVTNSFSPQILRLTPEASELEVWFEDVRFQTGDIGLNGLTFTDPKTLYVVTYHNAKLFRLDLDEAGAVAAIAEIASDRPLELGDGMKTLASDRLLLVEGSGSLTALTITGDEVLASTVSKGYAFPTTVAVRDGEAWLVEGQLDRLFTENGPLDARLPFTIHRVQLGHFGG